MTTPPSCGRSARHWQSGASASSSLRADAAVDAAPPPPHSPDIFAMCERGAILDRLATACRRQARSSSTRPTRIRNTYRHRMIELFARHQVPAPASRDRRDRLRSQLPPCTCAWIKRYDFHATQADDVMYAASEDGLARSAATASPRAASPSSSRRTTCEGDLVKFYGVRTGAGRPCAELVPVVLPPRQRQSGHAFDRGAAARGRGVRRRGCARGRDFRRRRHHHGPTANPIIIDLNAWPSYRVVSRSGRASDRGLPGPTLPGGVRALVT